MWRFSPLLPLLQPTLVAPHSPPAQVIPLSTLWSNFPRLQLFLMIFQRSLDILKLLQQFCMPPLFWKRRLLLSPGGNLENLPVSKARHEHMGITVSASPQQTVGTANPKSQGCSLPSQTDEGGKKIPFPSTLLLYQKRTRNLLVAEQSGRRAETA